MYIAVEYYSAFKKKKILQHAVTQVNFDDIVLIETNQSQNGHYCMILLTYAINSQNPRIEQELPDAGEEEMGSY